MLEIRRFVETEVGYGRGEFVSGQQRLNLALPDIELAFLVFGIGVERGVEAAGRCGHFTYKPSEQFVRYATAGLGANSRASSFLLLALATRVSSGNNCALS